MRTRLIATGIGAVLAIGLLLGVPTSSATPTESSPATTTAPAPAQPRADGRVICEGPQGQPCTGLRKKVKKLRHGKYGVLGKLRLPKKLNKKLKRKYKRAVHRYRHSHKGRSPKYKTWGGFKRHMRCFGNGRGKKRNWCLYGVRKAHVRTDANGLPIVGSRWDWKDPFVDAFSSMKRMTIRCKGEIVGGAIGGGALGAVAGGVGALPGAAEGALLGAGTCEGAHLVDKFIW